MLIAHYVGDHKNDGILARLGWAATRLAQKGRFSTVTHTEAILCTHGVGVATIASSSVRDGGVRVKQRCSMNPESWLISSVPYFDAKRAANWFAWHEGAQYDMRGAWATLMPGHHESDRWFCNEAVGASVGLLEPHTFTPSTFAALCFSIGTDATKEFFALT